MDARKNVVNRTSNVSSKKNTKKKKNKKLNIKLIVLFTIIAFVIIGVYLMCTLDIFNLNNVSVIGNEKYTVDEIMTMSNLQIGENMFFQLLKKRTENIIKLPYIKSVNVKILSLNDISIEVIERKMCYFAYDKEKNKYFRLDEEGYILEEQTLDNKNSEELLVYGINFDDEVTLGTQINEIDLSKLVIYANIVNELYYAGIKERITKVNFENSLTTLTLNDKLNVILPNDTEIKYKVALLQQIMLSLSSDAVGVIDMTKTNPVYSTF